jgi:paraquat-inducible protein B
MKFDSANKLIRYSVFIDAPYHELVNDAVRFYDVSGISLQASADGISVNTGSLDTVLLGGVAFSLPTGMQRGQPVQKGTEFKLYPSLEAIDKNPYRYGAYYVMSFNQSLRGLHPGAPVEYRGLRLGRVERILLKEFTSSGLTRAGAPIPVLVYLEPGRLEIGDTSGAVDMLNNAVIKGVPLGMRATLATGNLLTGALYINVDYFDDVEPAEVGEMFGYPTFPTVSGGFERIERQVNRLLEKFNNLPLEDTVATVNGAVAELESTLASLDVILEDSSTQALPAEIGKAVKELRATLKGFDPDSPLYQSLNASMYELNRTLENLRALTKTLSEQPNAALLPVELPPDPVPEARP